MVYESDFYTTRRPYHRPSPTISSYTVTVNPSLIPAVGKARTHHSTIPHIAHKRMNNLITPAPHNQVRKSVIRGVLDQIQHKPRRMESYDPTEDFLNERSIISFDDTARSIRAHTAALLKQVHTPVPKAIRPLAVSNLYNNYRETPISERITSDEYITHLLRPLPGKKPNGIDVSYYPETAHHGSIGKTHLACLTYAGGHAIPRRRHLMVSGDENHRNVRSDVELLSHYTKMRQAANADYQKSDQRPLKENKSVDIDSDAKQSSTPKENGEEAPKLNGYAEADDQYDDEEPPIVAKSSVKGSRKQSKEVSFEGDQLPENRRPSLKKSKKPSKDVSFDEVSISEQEKYKQEKLEAELKQMEAEEAENKRLEQAAAEAEKRRLEEEERIEREQKELEDRLAEEYRKEQERRLEEERKLQEKLAEERILAEQKELEEKLNKIKAEQEQLDEQQDAAENEPLNDDVFETESNEPVATLVKRKSVNDEFDWSQIETEQSSQPAADSGGRISESNTKEPSEYEGADSDDEPAVAETIRTISGSYSRKIEVQYSEEPDSAIGRRDSAKSSQISHTETEKSAKSAASEDSKAKTATDVADDKTDNTEAESELSENEADPIVDEPVTPEKEKNQNISNGVDFEEVDDDESDDSE